MLGLSIDGRAERHDVDNSGHEITGLSAILAHWADRSPDAPCLTFTTLQGAERTWTYAGLRRQSSVLAESIAAAGVSPGDRCIIHTGNSPTFVLVFWALQELGAVAVPTITQYSVDELRFVVSGSGARMLFCDDLLVAPALEATKGFGCQVVAETSGVAPWSIEDFLTQSPPTHETQALSNAAPDAPAVVIYTSGTTSRPKGVMLGAAGITFTAESFAGHMRLQSRDITLVVLPLFHVNALLLQLMPAFYTGGHVVLAPRFSATRYWKWVGKYGITVTHLVAGPIRLLLAAGDPKPEQVAQVRLMTFGMPLTDAEMEEADRRFGFPLTMIWGLTETGCGATLMPLDHLRRAGHQAIGPALPGWEVAVADPEDGDHIVLLDDAEQGELVVRSPGVMLGYLGREDATRETIFDGWVRTGDLGWRDENGYFHFVDRLKDMLKPNGENVAASEVERVLAENPSIVKCAVVGIPDAIRGELVVAFVVPAPGAGVSADEIRDWCSERLAAFKVPSQIHVRSELPETSIGKPRKAELRQALLDELERTQAQ